MEMNEKDEWVRWCGRNLPLSYQIGLLIREGGGEVMALLMVVMRGAEGVWIERERR